MVREEIIKWLVAFVLGSMASAIGTGVLLSKNIIVGLQCLLRAEILRQYEKWFDRGYCPIYAKQALEREYKVYHKFGGNDVATEKYHDLLELPDEPPREKEV